MFKNDDFLFNNSPEILPITNFVGQIFTIIKTIIQFFFNIRFHKFQKTQVMFFLVAVI
jgi:hypothetical protein